MVSWNTHVGGGDLDALVADLTAGRLTSAPVVDYILLLQEVYRAGPDVPRPSPDRGAWAAPQRPSTPGRQRRDIVAAARALALDLIYVPSMRNGSPGESDEDRGSAILSTLPLRDAVAIELPLERQRRVAVTATAGGLRVASAHFSNMVAHHLWILAEPARVRQARALAQVLRDEPGPMVLGGDFNSWFGHRDAAYRTLVRDFSGAAAPNDPRPTFGRLRLDHLLFRLPDGWRASVRRADQRYGSDHFPLIATIEPPR